MGFSLQEIFSNKYFFYGVVIGIFILIIYYVYSSYTNNQTMITDEIYEEDNYNSNVAEVMLFYVDWCPHCKSAMPIWEKLKKQYNNQKINGYEVIFVEFNCTDEDEEITKKIETYKIEGFPTVKLKANGTVVEFDAKINEENMEKFLSTVLNP